MIVFQGPTSSWSFTHRVLKTLATHLSPEAAVELPIITDGDAYEIKIFGSQTKDAFDFTELPSREHAIYLMNTANFHIGQLFHLYDEASFLRNLHELYDRGQQKAQTSRLWYIQFLVVISFGETFLLPSRKANPSSVCSGHFIRAMSLLPDQTEMWNDPILSIEVLALIALYLYSLDMRDSSCCYVLFDRILILETQQLTKALQIGQAMRMALIEGLHREQPPEVEPKLAERWTNVWWTVYTLDSKFSASVGVPRSVRDEDVTTHLWDPVDCSKRNAGFSLHVKVSQVMTRVVNSEWHMNPIPLIPLLTQNSCL